MVANTMPLLCLCGFEADTDEELQEHAFNSRCRIYRCGCCRYFTFVRGHLAFHKKTNKYKCDLCDEEFNKNCTLNVHLEQVHRDMETRLKPPNNMLQCTECSYQTRFKSNMEKHVKRLHPACEDQTENIGCKACPYRTKRLKFLKKHYQKKHSEGKLKCKRCKFEVHNDWKAFWNHVSITHTKGAKFCPHCNFKCMLKATMTKHIKNEHADKKADHLSCSKCDFWCLYVAELNNHRKKSHPEEEEVNSSSKSKFSDVDGLEDPSIDPSRAEISIERMEDDGDHDEIEMSHSGQEDDDHSDEDARLHDEEAGKEVVETFVTEETVLDDVIEVSDTMLT